MMSSHDRALNRLNDEIDDLSTDVEFLTEENEELKARIAELESENEELNARIAELESGVAKND